MTQADRDPPAIEAEVELPDGRRFHARMVDLGERSIAVAAPRRSVPELDGGDRLSVTIRSPALSGPVHARAHVERVLEEGPQTRVTLHFAEVGEFQALLDAGIGSVFNRRFAYRVQPADGEPIAMVVHPTPDEPVAVALQTDGDLPPLVGTVEDISVTGVGFVLPEATAGVVRVGSRVTLALELPPYKEVARVAGLVRYRAPWNEGQRIGVDYDRGSALFEAASESITTYVMRRQRELLRAKHTAN
ncbi:MAG: PilZ domain-containing protein [Deltaproteobacteria bacterium]|nr:PilZ domain-containing protein [Deltaproteobacteria bacterium]MCB9787805.1 PilZ domain-containing protein [Deltaproteobacteria bacterium]